MGNLIVIGILLILVGSAVFYGNKRRREVNASGAHMQVAVPEKIGKLQNEVVDF